METLTAQHARLLAQVDALQSDRTEGRKQAAELREQHRVLLQKNASLAASLRNSASVYQTLLSQQSVTAAEVREYAIRQYMRVSCVVDNATLGLFCSCFILFPSETQYTKLKFCLTIPQVRSYIDASKYLFEEHTRSAQVGPTIVS
jgi:hypothetical protein